MAKEQDKETKKTKKKKVVKKIETAEKKEDKEEKVVVKKEEKPKKRLNMNYCFKDTIIIMVLSMIIGLGIGIVATRISCNKKDTKELKEFDEVYSEIIKNGYTNSSNNELTIASLKGLIYGLNDKYAYINENINSIMTYEENKEGKFNGLGITIMLGEDGKISIISVNKDSPAEKSGLKVGDQILKLDDEYYDMNNYDEFSYNIKTSKIGKTVKLDLLRNNEMIKKEVTIDTIEVESVFYSLIEQDGKKIGRFTFNNFADNTYDQFYSYYKDAKNQIDGIILDVRCNAEGKMENAAKIASLFLAEGDIIYYNYDGKEYEAVKSDSKREINLPVVVVIDSGTISSGEMLASTLNENVEADIVGTKSYGKGLLQKMIPLSNGKSLYYTTNEWVTSKKKKVEGLGINPTVEAKCDDKCENDVIFDKAIETVLKNMKQATL